MRKNRQHPWQQRYIRHIRQVYAVRSRLSLSSVRPRCTHWQCACKGCAINRTRGLFRDNNFPHYRETSIPQKHGTGTQNQPRISHQTCCEPPTKIRTSFRDPSETESSPPIRDDPSTSSITTASLLHVSQPTARHSIIYHREKKKSPPHPITHAHFRPGLTFGSGRGLRPLRLVGTPGPLTSYTALQYYSSAPLT
jgi:hypothetical protein